MIKFSSLTRFTAQRLNTLCLSYEMAYSEQSEKHIHDLRVSLRRNHSHLEYILFLYDQHPEFFKKFRPMSKKIRRHIRALSSLRNLQTQILYISSQSALCPDVDVLLNEMKREEQLLLVNLRYQMDEWRLQKIRRKLIRFMIKNPLPDKELELRSVLYLNLLTDRLHEAVHLCCTPDICGCHTLRIRLKEYRYHLEMLEQAFGLKQILMGAVKQWLADLGALQDKRVLLKRLEKPEYANLPQYAPLLSKIQLDIEELLLQVQEEANAIRFETQIK